MTPVSRSELTVGIDIGTTSVKAVAVDGDGTIVARARVPHRLIVPQPDQLEHDAGQAWRRGPRRALAAVRQPGTKAVCVASMVPSMTGVDRKGIPRTPGLLYGDGRGRTGSTASPAGSGEVVEFLRWTSKQLPDAHGFWPAPAVATHALCGTAVLDSGTAFSSYPLYSGTEWNEEMLGELAIRPTQMPRVANIGEAVAPVDDDLMLAAGTVDAMGEQIVAGADKPGDVLVVCGTTLLPWAVIDEWREEPGLWTIPHTAPGRILIGGASNAGGLFLNWARQLLARGRNSVDPRRVPVWEPYVRGERTPYHDPDRRAVLHDLDLTHDAAAVRRAAFEAAGFVVRQHLELAGVADGARRIVATGGGTRVPEWLQCLADCTGLPVDVVAAPEGAALGAAFIARMSVGLEQSLDDAARWVRYSHRVEPDEAWVGPVAERYQRFRALADAATTATE